MRFTHTFIDRPILATVVSVFITLVGLGALFVLPVSQYPEIVPPTVQVTTNYPGASADVVAQTVATPLEQQINGVENMLYMSSQSTGDGKLTITVTFRIGTDLNVAQMLTQNRVEDALPRLPEDVQRLGVQVRKATPNILLAVHLYSPDGSRDNLYLSNYATLHVKDQLARLPGLGDVQLFGARDYAMRIWLDPDQGRSLQAERRRSARGVARAERAGVGGHPQPAACCREPGLPAQCGGARPTHHT
jgi:multidrug efflux pump